MRAQSRETTTQQLTTVSRYVEQAKMQIDLMRTAMHRVDTDFELTGAVSCDSIEFIRTVQRVIA